ncbi:MAG: hypothetical protein PVJ86_00530 [Phycisphaerales bacterium]|jgi:hypothetical protein
MGTYTLRHPPINKPKTIQLIKKWSDWDTGDIITMDSEKAERVKAKGYAVDYKPPKKPAVETQTAELDAEQAVVTPQAVSKPRPKSKRKKED